MSLRSRMPRSRYLLSVAIVLTTAWLHLSARHAHAGQVLLPTTLDQLQVPGSFAVVGPEPDTYSIFTFSSSAIPPGTPVVTTDQLKVSEFHSGIESGLELAAPFFAPAATLVEYQISFVVTAPMGFNIFDALLGVADNQPSGTTGSTDILESLSDPGNGSAIGSLSLSSPTMQDTTNFTGVSSILVNLDIFLDGGSLGTGVDTIDLGFSSAVPEPSSMAMVLLGFGLSGLFISRRSFKRAPGA